MARVKFQPHSYLIVSSFDATIQNATSIFTGLGHKTLLKCTKGVQHTFKISNMSKFQNQK